MCAPLLCESSQGTKAASARPAVARGLRPVSCRLWHHPTVPLSLFWVGCQRTGRQGASNKLTALANKARAALDWMKTLFCCCGHGIPFLAPGVGAGCRYACCLLWRRARAEGAERSRRKSLLALASPQTTPCPSESQGQPGGEPGLPRRSRLSEPQTCGRAAVATACDALGAGTRSWAVRAQSISKARK